MLRLILAFVIAAGPTASTWANDSSAELTNGGLIFVRNNDVEMRAEDLFISMDEVRVKYRFFNKGDRDVTVLVAFPMPEIRVEGADSIIAVPTDDPVNFLAFTTMVNGAPVKTEVEQRVFAAGIDRTQLLRSLGIPLAPHLQATNDALDKLPREKWDDLVRIGLAEIGEFDTGSGMQKHLSARWGLQTTFYWQQTFPAKAETLIEHRYKPSVGGTSGTSFGAPNAAKEPSMQEYLRKYCIDKEFLAAANRAKRAAKSESSAPFSEARIDYILRTAVNWSGPIKDFRLVIDKGDANNLISFCGQGVKKIGATQFEMRKSDYSPEGNLTILILRKIAPP